MLSRVRLGLGIRRRMVKAPLDPARISWSFDIYSWLAELDAGQWVLDIGAGEGSFQWACRGCVAALDEDAKSFSNAPDRDPSSYHRVCGRGDRLPFGDRSIDLIICHHALEHLDGLVRVLNEMARVLKPDGRLYVAVPNGYGLCDAVYRFVFEGGGHLNRFARKPLAGMIERSVGVRLARWQKLYSSFAYLRRLMNLMATPPVGLSRRLRRLGRFPWALGAVQWVLYVGSRLADRVLGTDLGVYGWALYFDHESGPPVEDPPYANVCLNCGAGHHALSVHRPYPGVYRCKICDRVNPFVRPFRNSA